MTDTELIEEFKNSLIEGKFVNSIRLNTESDRKFNLNICACFNFVSDNYHHEAQNLISAFELYSDKLISTKDFKNI